jgi:hypothetical protein
VTLAPSDLTASSGVPITSADLLATALAEVNTAHDLEQVRALRRLRRLALDLEADTWASWARTELKRAHRLRRCGL